MTELRVQGISKKGKCDEYVFIHSMHPYDEQYAVTIFKVRKGKRTFFAMHLLCDVLRWAELPHALVLSSDFKFASGKDYIKFFRWLQAIPEIFRNEALGIGHRSAISIIIAK